MLIAAVTLIIGIEIPLRLALGYQMSRTLFLLNILFVILFIIDIVINFISSFQNKDDSDKNSPTPARYLKRRFILDLFAAIPFFLFATSSYRWLSLLRLAKIMHINHVFNVLKKEHNLNPSVVRLGVFLFWLLVGAHIMACGWIGLGAVEQGLSMRSTYTCAIYWCITTLTTVGYGDITPTEDIQKIYTMIVMILGVGVYGYVIGNIATLFANIDVTKAAFIKKMEDIGAFMRYKKIPKNIQDKVTEYYNYLWESRQGQREQQVLDDLPLSLKTEISLQINKDIIQKVDLFKNLSEKFIREVINELKPEVFIPGDYIVHKGDEGDGMYFISKGEVDVLNDEETASLITLKDGQFFGEIALIQEGPRTKSVRTRTYCDLYKLEKEKFLVLLAKYPEFEKIIQEKVKALTEEKK